MKRKILLLLCILFAAAFVVSAVGLGFVLNRYRQDGAAYEDLQDEFVLMRPQNPAPTSAQTTAPTPTQTRPAATTAAEADGTAGSEPRTEPEITAEPEPEITEQAPIVVDFDKLLKKNSDVIGWLYCEGTAINYPVVQSSDNEDYLHAGLDGKYLYSGTLFADYRCSAIGTDQNHIIYGHTMGNGTMFGKLRNYKKQSYYDQHPVLYYLTPERDYRIDLFAGLITESTSALYYPNFNWEDGFKDTLKKITSKSTFKSDVTVTENDHIVMLSSCDYTFDNARYVVFGKLTPLYPQN